MPQSYIHVMFIYTLCLKQSIKSFYLPSFMFDFVCVQHEQIKVRLTPLQWQCGRCVYEAPVLQVTYHTTLRIVKLFIFITDLFFKMKKTSRIWTQHTFHRQHKICTIIVFRKIYYRGKVITTSFQRRNNQNQIKRDRYIIQPLYNGLT